MPLFWVELALGNGIERRACLYGEVGDHEASVVEREVVMDGLGEHAVTIIEEEDEEEDDRSY